MTTFHRRTPDARDAYHEGVVAGLNYAARFCHTNGQITLGDHINAFRDDIAAFYNYAERPSSSTITMYIAHD